MKFKNATISCWSCNLKVTETIWNQAVALGILLESKLCNTFSYPNRFNTKVLSNE